MAGHMATTVRIKEIKWTADYIPFARTADKDGTIITVCLLGRGTVRRYGLNRGSLLRLHKRLYILDSMPSLLGPADITFAPSTYDQWQAFRQSLRRYVSRRRLLLLFQGGIHSISQLQKWSADPERVAVPGIGPRTLSMLRNIIDDRLLH